MKQLINFDPLFDPSNKTLDFRFYPNFQPNLLYGVINVTRNQILYAPGTSTYGGTFSGSVLTLTFDTSAYDTRDVLNVYYETDPAEPSTLYNNTAREHGGMLEAQYILLREILTELKVMNYMLQQGFYPNPKDDLDELRRDMTNENVEEALESTGLG